MSDPIDGWDEHRRRQIREIAETTPAQRLAWLEETIDLVLRAGAIPLKDRQDRADEIVPPPSTSSPA